MPEVNTILEKYQLSVTNLMPIYMQGRENARYLRGDNWNKRDKDRHIKQGFFQAYSIPLIAVKVNRHLSMQRQNRILAKCRGRGREDELTAEVLNSIKDYGQQKSGYTYVESDLFKDGLAKKYGVIMCYVDYTDDVQGEIKYRNIPFDQFYWDTNAITYNIYDDATFAGAFEWIPADRVKQMYPEFEWANGNADSNLEENYYNNNLVLTDWCDPKKRLVKVCNHFDKTIHQKYLVRNTADSSGGFIPFDSKKEAESYIVETLAKLQSSIVQEAQLNISITGDDFKVIPKKLQGWDNVVFSGTNEISRKAWRYSVPCYHRYCSMFDTGEFWSLIDLARDSQKAFDRYTSMIDKATVKNIKGNNYTYIKKELGPKFQNNPEQLFADASSGGKYFEVMNHSAIAPLEKQNNIAVESALAQSYQGLVEEIMGGRTFQGLDSDVKQTATEVATLEKNAQQTANLFIDNLGRFLKGFTEYEVELIKDIYTPDRTFRVLGESMSKKVQMAFEKQGIYEPSSLFSNEYGFMNLAKLPKPLYDCNLDIIIDEVSGSSYEKREKFNQIMAYNAILLQNGYSPLPAEVLLENSTLDPTIKAEIYEWQAQQEQARSENMKLQQDQQKVDSLVNIVNATKPPEPKPMKKETVQ